MNYINIIKSLRTIEADRFIFFYDPTCLNMEYALCFPHERCPDYAIIHRSNNTIRYFHNYAEALDHIAVSVNTVREVQIVEPRKVF